MIVKNQHRRSNIHTYNLDWTPLEDKFWTSVSDFYIIRYWIFSFIFIFDILITVHIINLDIVHNQKSNCKFLSNVKTVFQLVLFYIQCSYKHIFILYPFIKYHYNFSIRLKYFIRCLSHFHYFKVIIVSGIRYFFTNTLDALTNVRHFLIILVAKGDRCM